MYQALENGAVSREADGAIIPADPGNTDYQAFLKWQEEGNTPTPYTPPPPPSIISASAWLDRFTPAEQLAVQAACLSNPTIQLGLTVGLAQGWIDLAQPRAANWLALLVAEGAIDTARTAELLTLPG